jgi:hypothetical protein
MNCEEVKAHLLDYLDKTLDTPTTTRVATHLISCAPCGAEASELADCMDQVTALPALDPPLGFAQRVMAHVREIEKRPTIWERLFMPWSNWTKWMPLQATALVMVGIIGIVLYQKDNRLKPTEPTNRTLSASVKPGTPSNESIPAVTNQTDKKKEAALQAPVALAKRAEQVAEKKQRSSPSSEQSQIAKREVEARSEETKISRRAPIQVQEAINMREPGRFSGEGGFAPPMPLGGLRQAAPRPGTMALDRVVPLGERVADYEFVVRRRPPQRRDQVESSSADALKKSTDEDTASGLAARPATPPPTAPKIESIAEIRFYNVAPEHFEYFKKELASEAIIETEPKPPAAKEKEIADLDRLLLIKVTILPPALPEPAAPPR